MFQALTLAQAAAVNLEEVTLHKILLVLLAIKDQLLAVELLNVSLAQDLRQYAAEHSLTARDTHNPLLEANQEVEASLEVAGTLSRQHRINHRQTNLLSHQPSPRLRAVTLVLKSVQLEGLALWFAAMHAGGQHLAKEEQLRNVGQAVRQSA